MQSNNPADVLARKHKERFEGSVHALAIVALAREVYSDDDRRRLLDEYPTLLAAHKAAVDANLSLEEVKVPYQAMTAFEKAHPLIVSMHSKIRSLTGMITVSS